MPSFLQAISHAATQLIPEHAARFLRRWVLDPRWRTIRTLGEARILGVSATVIIIVPFLSRAILLIKEWQDGVARSLHQVHPALEELFLKVLGNLELPLVLKLVVASAFCAFAAKIIYELGCPTYIKAGDLYNQFRHSHSHAISVLESSFRALWNSGDEKIIEKVRRGLRPYGLSFMVIKSTFEEYYEPLQLGQSVYVNYRGQLLNDKLIDYLLRPEFGEAFFVVVRDIGDESRKPIRVICALSYILALMLAAAAIANQLIWAWRGLVI